MKTFRIIVKNGANCEIYNRLFNAETENEALKMFLENEIIYCDDSITISED
jgi:hypothetical protein